MRELPDERQIVVQRLLNVRQIVFRHKKQRLGAHHRQVVLVKNVAEQVGFRRHFRGEPFDKLPVFFRVVALHDHDQIVSLLRKLLLQREKIPVIPLVGGLTVAAWVDVRLQVANGVKNTHQEQDHLGRNKPALTSSHRLQLLQVAQNGTGPHRPDNIRPRAGSCLHRLVGEIGVGKNFLHFWCGRKESFDRAAGLAAKIFSGTKPADLPFELPTRYLFVINLKTAKAMDFTVPNNVLALADEVIE